MQEKKSASKTSMLELRQKILKNIVLEMCCSAGTATTAATFHREKWAPGQDEPEDRLSQQTQAFIPGFVLKCYSEWRKEQNW